jgi:hypothetical protein
LAAALFGAGLAVWVAGAVKVQEATVQVRAVLLCVCGGGGGGSAPQQEEGAMCVRRDSAERHSRVSATRLAPQNTQKDTKAHTHTHTHKPPQQQHDRSRRRLRSRLASLPASRRPC